MRRRFGIGGGRSRALDRRKLARRRLIRAWRSGRRRGDVKFPARAGNKICQFFERLDLIADNSAESSGLRRRLARQFFGALAHFSARFLDFRADLAGEVADFSRRCFETAARVVEQSRHFRIRFGQRYAHLFGDMKALVLRCRARQRETVLDQIGSSAGCVLKRSPDALRTLFDRLEGLLHRCRQSNHRSLEGGPLFLKLGDMASQRRMTFVESGIQRLLTLRELLCAVDKQRVSLLKRADESLCALQRVPGDGAKLAHLSRNVADDLTEFTQTFADLRLQSGEIAAGLVENVGEGRIGFIELCDDSRQIGADTVVRCDQRRDRCVRPFLDSLGERALGLIERAHQFVASFGEMARDRRTSALNGVGDEFADIRQFARHDAALFPERGFDTGQSLVKRRL